MDFAPIPLVRPLALDDPTHVPESSLGHHVQYRSVHGLEPSHAGWRCVVGYTCPRVHWSVHVDLHIRNGLPAPGDNHYIFPIVSVPHTVPTGQGR
jgi:hypothetical protein